VWHDEKHCFSDVKITWLLTLPLVGLARVRDSEAWLERGMSRED
jgi:hypothetical protein